MDKTKTRMRWLVAIAVVLAIAAVGLGVAWGVTGRRAEAETARLEGKLENGYKQNYCAYDCSPKPRVCNKCVLNSTN